MPIGPLRLAGPAVRALRPGRGDRARGWSPLAHLTPPHPGRDRAAARVPAPLGAASPAVEALGPEYQARLEERWAPMFELLDVDLLAGDLFQVMLTLRRG
jgi:hypothetical protein